MVRRNDYKDYWCGLPRCFWCALWYNGTRFHWTTTLTQLLLMLFTVLAPILPWLHIWVQTGNHLERVRQSFDFLDANANNVLEFEELSSALKDLQYIDSGKYQRNRFDMISVLFADQNSGCLKSQLKSLARECAVGDRATCLQAANWALEGGNFLKNPEKLRSCVTGLMDADYVQRTGDDCVNTFISNWLDADSQSNGAKCLRSTKIDIEEFSLQGQRLVPGMNATELANHCINATFDAYLSVYGAVTLTFSVTSAWDGDQARCHSFTGRIAPSNFTCSTILDVWNGKAYDIPRAQFLGPTLQCRDLASWMIDIFDGQLSEYGCDIQCSPQGKAMMGPGCILKPSVAQRLNRDVNSPFVPTCTTRVGTGIQGDSCVRDTVCPACTFPINTSGVVEDVSPRLSMHAGASDTSAIYDALCWLSENRYMKEIINTVRSEREQVRVSTEEMIEFKRLMSEQCETKLSNGEFEGGVVEMVEATDRMKSWPSNLKALQQETFTCTCEVNAVCSECIEACVDKAFYFPETQSSYETAVSCGDEREVLLRTVGGAAFVNKSDVGGSWACTGDSCKLALGAIDPVELPFLGTVREYIQPHAVLAILEIFYNLCPVTYVIVTLYSAAFAMQCFNLYSVWLTIRSSDNLSVADSWKQEQWIMSSCVITALIILTPALLYGVYIALYAKTLQFGSPHSLSAGWYLAVVASTLTAIPFHGAWKSYVRRPLEWRNAMSRFKVAHASELDWARSGVVPGAGAKDIESGVIPEPRKMRAAFEEVRLPGAQ